MEERQKKSLQERKKRKTFRKYTSKAKVQKKGKFIIAEGPYAYAIMYKEKVENSYAFLN